MVCPTASHNEEVEHSEGRLFPAETKERSSGLRQERNTQYLNDAAGPSTRLSLNVPRNLSLYPRASANEFGITNLSWDDSSESEEDVTAHDHGNAGGSNTSREPSHGGRYSSTGGRRPGTLGSEASYGTTTITTTSSSRGGVSLSTASQSPKRAPAFELEVVEGAFGPASSYLRPRSSTSASSLSSSSSSRTEKPQDLADWYSMHAEAFLASLDPTVNPSGSTRATVSGLSGLAKYTYVDATTCMVAVLLGLAKGGGDAQRVHAVDEVTANNALQQIKIVYRVKKGGRDSNFWEKHRARVRRAVGIYKYKQQVQTIQLPQGCVADPESRYFMFSTGTEARRSRALVLDSVVLSLGFSADPFRVPRTPTPKPVTAPAVLLPNTWIPAKCTWFLRFHRSLSEPPLLKIDREKGLVVFQNEELHDMQMSFLDENQHDASARCEWSSPLLSKVHVVVDTKETPPEWKIQLDLAERTDLLILERKIKANSSVNLGLPADLTGRGIRMRERDSLHIPLE